MTNSLVKVVKITQALQDELSQLTSRGRPNEVCALIFGIQRETTLCLDTAAQVRNSHTSNNHFAVASQDLRSAMAAQKSPHCAIYHSHPHKTHPSKKDIRGIKNSNVPWLIGALQFNKGSPPFLNIEAFLARSGRVYVLPITKGVSR